MSPLWVLVLLACSIILGFSIPSQDSSKVDDRSGLQGPDKNVAKSFSFHHGIVSTALKHDARLKNLDDNALSENGRGNVKVKKREPVPSSYLSTREFGATTPRADNADSDDHPNGYFEKEISEPRISSIYQHMTTSKRTIETSTSNKDSTGMEDPPCIKGRNCPALELQMGLKAIKSEESGTVKAGDSGTESTNVLDLDNGNDGTSDDYDTESEDSSDIFEEDEIIAEVFMDDPIDRFACDECTCHHVSAWRFSEVFADCSNKDKGNMFIPQNLPKDRKLYLKLSKNELQLDNFGAFALYPLLRILELDHNLIQRLRYKVVPELRGLENLTLKHNNISTLEDRCFAYLPHLRRMSLAHNRLTTISNLTFWGLKHLASLDLSFNELSHINFGAFDNCKNLVHLLMDRNEQLNYGTQSLSARLFRPLKKLTLLSIAGFNKSETSYPISALAELHSLENLTIDGPEIGHFDSRMTKLRKLRKIIIGARGGCNITNLSAGFLENLSTLTKLDIRDCKLSEISDRLYEPVPKLRALWYEGIRYPFDGLFDHLSGLKNSSIQELMLNTIRGIDSCRILTERHVENIQYMNELKRLILENNAIVSIDQKFINGLPQSLIQLSIRKNMIVQSSSILPLIGHLKNIQILKEDRQNRLSVQFESLESSRHRVNKTIVQNEHMKNKYLSTYSTRRPNASPFKPPVHINLSLYTAAESFRFGYFFLTSVNSTAKKLILSNSFNGALSNKHLSPLVENVDLSNNSWDVLSNNFFFPNNTLKSLNMRNNFLSNALSQDVNGSKFSYLNNVEYIDISNNYIQSLPPLIFKGLVSLKGLYLSNNNIHSLNISLKHMNSLVFIDLSGNSLIWISQETRNDLDDINENNHKLKIDFTRNPFQCTCASIEVMRWLATTRVHLLSKDFLTCIDENQHLQSIGDLKERLTSLQRRCLSSGLVVVATSSSIAIVFIITLAIVVFRNRWKLHYLRNIAITKFYGFRREEADDPNYTFDAYFLYAEEDRSFVLRECLRELEEKRGHRLCVDDRDFLPGTFMPCNITSAISSSRMTIPVISPDFWEDDWSEYGLQMAVMESIHAKRNVLHLLLYKHVPVEDMSRDLIKVHKDNRFSEYPPESCSDDVREAFWDALSHVIGHTNNPDGQLLFDF